MAGIGFPLRKLARSDNILGLVQGYIFSTLISAGPWIITVIGIAGITMVASQLAAPASVSGFRTILIYNFSFSLVLSGPVALVTTRYVADAIFTRSLDLVPGAMLTALALVYGIALVAALPFYGFIAELSPGLRAVAVANFLVTSGIWLVVVFLTALKDFISVVVIFVIGTVVAFFGSTLLAESYGAAGMLLGFTIGLAVVQFAIIGKVFASYPRGDIMPVKLFAYFRDYWELAVGGLVYNAAIWADKWIMWFAPEREVFGGVMSSFPAYDGAMFFAFVTIIPAMALFTVSVETGFFENYHKFYRSISNHGTYQQLRRGQREIMSGLALSSRNMVILQGAVTAVAVILAPQIVQLARGDALQIGIFRLGVLAAFFHVSLLFVSIVLAYFDLRRLTLAIQVLFLAMNIGFTLATLHFGFRFYGYGYFLAALISFFVAFVAVERVLTRLPYVAFVRANPSVRK